MSAAASEAASTLGVGRPTKRRAGSVAGGLPVADSRPRFVEGRVEGSRCRVCRYPSAQVGLVWCPVCGGDIESESFGPAGRIWSSTVVRIPVTDRKPPFALAYLDLDDGPRVMVHLSEPQIVPPGTVAQVTGIEDGALVATVGEGSDA